MRTATLFNFLVESSLIGGWMIALLLALRPLIRRGAGSRVVWLLWALVALRLLVPLALPNPLMNWIRPTLSLDTGIRPMADQVRTRMDDAARELSFAFSGRGTVLGTLLWRVAGATGNGRLAFAGMIVYLVGVVLCGAWMAAQNVRFFRRMRSGDAGTVGDAACAAPVRRVRGLRGSCTYGLLHPSIAVPEDASGDNSALMLLRERAHLAGRDTVWCVVRDLCCAVHWFNPLVWLAACVSRVDCELACDERVLAPLDPERREAYARALIHAPDSRRATPSVAVCATLMTMRRGPLTVRIRQALHGKPAGAGAIAAVALAAAVAVMLMFGTAEESSIKNIPALPSEPFHAGALADEQAAEAAARAFLALPGVNSPELTSAPYVTEQAEGWQVEFLTEAGASVIVQLTERGAVTGYYNGTIALDRLRPLAFPITDETREGELWRAYLRDFLRLVAPEALADCDGVYIVDSARLDGERFLYAYLTCQDTPLWHVILQVSPFSCLLAFQSERAAPSLDAP